MRRFLLLPFRNVTRTEQQEWLVTGAPLIIAEALGQFQDLTVVPEEVVTAARRRLRLPDGAPDATQLRRLAEETGGWTAVTGNLFASAGRTRVTVQAMDVPTSRVIARADATVGTDEDVRAAFRSLSLKLLEPTGVRAASQEGIAFATTSIDAYRAYARGHAAYQRSQYRVAQAAFNEAVRLDSGFALAWAGLAANGPNIEGLGALVNPFSGSYRAVERASRLADRMPARQARFIRGIQALFRGEIMLSRRLIDSLAATDPNDLDTHLWLASGELITPLLDTTGTELRPIGSWNRALAVTQHILDRDPGRRSAYVVPAFAHATAAGMWWGGVRGKRREGGTLAMMLTSEPDATFVPVLRDTFEFVRRASFDSFPASEQARLRRRSAEAGMTYVDRWLAAGPDDAEARLWASRFAELLDDPSRAVREMEIADSLGVESSMENVVGRRLTLLVGAQRYPEAGALADSLLGARQLEQRPFVRFLDRRRQSAAAAFLLSRNWESARRLAEIIGPAAPGRPACSGLEREMADVGVESLRPQILRAVMDTIALHFADISKNAGLARCVESLVSLGPDPAVNARATVAAALRTQADSLHRAGENAVAYRAARAAWSADSSDGARARLLALRWFVERSRRMAVGRHFAPISLIVEGDSVTLLLRRTTSEAIEIDAPELATNWFVNASARGVADSVAFLISLQHARIPTATGQSGGVPEFIASLTTTRAVFSIRGAEPPAAPPPVVTATTDGVRVVARGPFVVIMKAARPGDVEFSSGPCLGLNEGLCARPRIPITYR